MGGCGYSDLHKYGPQSLPCSNTPTPGMEWSIQSKRRALSRHSQCSPRCGTPTAILDSIRLAYKASSTERSFLKAPITEPAAKRAWRHP